MITTSLLASTALVPALGVLALLGLIPLCFFSYIRHLNSID
ncbi:MAG TPA: hypothetical protein VHK65_01625 [Candidatus Dormibacteraeota bacterium]|nr:hypothetical protein [Candidatus Dormibacteraeota bacterium]